MVEKKESGEKIKTPKKLNDSEVFFELQKRIKVIKKDGTNPHYNSKYATLDKALPEVREHMEEVGVCVSQPLEIMDGKNILKTIIFRADTGAILAESSSVLIYRAENNIQDLMGAITYFRRYQLLSLLGIATEDDKDGETSDETIEKTVKEADNVNSLIRFYKSLPVDKQKKFKNKFSEKKNEIEEQLAQNNQELISQVEIKGE